MHSMGIAGTFGEKQGGCFHSLQHDAELQVSFWRTRIEEETRKRNENGFVPKSKMVESYPLDRFILEINTSYLVVHKIDLKLIC